jgi:hypothetical protein
MCFSSAARRPLPDAGVIDDSMSIERYDTGSSNSCKRAADVDSSRHDPGGENVSFPTLQAGSPAQGKHNAFPRKGKHETMLSRKGKHETMLSRKCLASSKTSYIH